MSQPDVDAVTPPRAHDSAAGGDPVCWLERVCDSCGALADGPPEAVCTRCGTERPAGPAA